MSSTTSVFVDTNVLLYRVLADPAEAAKRQRAMEVFRTQNCWLSVQVLQEFYFQATHPRRVVRASHEAACGFVREFLWRRVQPMTIPIFLAATETKQRFQISYWDAAIIEAARALGCATVYSEDLNDGQDYGGVRVENPFAGL
ncbi:MAG: PIN domain-containing protein [Solirubrobacterales bacterium]|nr:PIN domain-containing protein [Solirubrobacterales bacterium]